MAIILFFVSLILIIALFAVKYFGIAILRHEKLTDLVKENDQKIHAIVGKGKKIVKKVHFENFQRLIRLIVITTKEEAVYLKKKFDSKQPKFFLKPRKPGEIDKNKVSFFLKKVTDYKESLKG